VLQAAVIGEGGETFLLDMGEPVKIVQLARDLVQLSGLELDRDISIVFTGLRPGEKLTEELFNPTDQVERTSHEKIFTVRNGRPGVAQRGRINELLAAAEAGDGLRIRHLLAEIVPGYSVATTAGSTPGQAAASPPAVRRLSG
ncbi:MAG: polysaccharide biosynthesis protein, partial [Gemmatimonadetes bacterium]|nr:polysaccharide biosynthesis protein [Gemmatimonadota bacterium]